MFTPKLLKVNFVIKIVNLRGSCNSYNNSHFPHARWLGMNLIWGKQRTYMLVNSTQLNSTLFHLNIGWQADFCLFGRVRNFLLYFF